MTGSSQRNNVRGRAASDAAVSPEVVDAGAEVTPHGISALAWDIPSTIVTGERFRMKVGLKCSNECDLSNRDVGIYDDEGIQLAAASLSGDCWPETTALYFADVELDAPARAGLYTWSVRSPKSDDGIPHGEGSVSFGVRAVGRPDCLVTIEAVDKITQLPLAGAHVTMHPYKAVTDEHGVATVRVAKGTYKLFVSQTRFLTFGVRVEVTADMTERVELDVEPVLERN